MLLDGEAVVPDHPVVGQRRIRHVHTLGKGLSYHVQLSGTSIRDNPGTW